MTFISDKKLALQKEDRSIKGSIDSHIKPLCDLLNSKSCFYTTSTCSGRIVLSRMPESGKKDEYAWIFVSHEQVGFYNIKSELSDLPEDEVWFRFEPFIAHVAAATIEDANSLLKAAHAVGIKRAGIISMSPDKIMVEMIGNERIDAIIAKDRSLIVTENYLSLLVDKANEKLERNHRTIEKLKSAIEGL
jgi:tRNA wybutosine-synthesizing protein 3